MIINTRAKNGQPVQVIKTFKELTDEEKANINLDTAKDYNNFHIVYDKKGNLKNIKGYELSEKYLNKSKNTGIDIVDSMQLLFGRKHSKAYQSAKKRVGVTNEQVNDARVAIKIR